MDKPTLVLDTEIYRDYFLLSFMNIDTGNVRHFEMFDAQPLDIPTVRKIVGSYRLISFNGNHFDIPMITLALSGMPCSKLKETSDRIIKNGIKPWGMGIESIKCDHIDLIEIAPGIASLKLYGGRLHCRKLQELPIDEAVSISPDQRPILREYCANDLTTTLALYRKFEPQIRLREQMSEQYGIDLRSKSDAQVAEAVIRQDVEKKMRRRLEKKDPFGLAGLTFGYKMPNFLSDYLSSLRNSDGDIKSSVREAFDTVSDATFSIAGNGTVIMPKEVSNLKVKIGGSTYRMGIGGLHSSEKSICHYSDDTNLLIDRDVVSYYPSIIEQLKLEPQNMRGYFLPVYSGIKKRRIEAKQAGDKSTADSLKIAINGSFGKFGSPYSVLYAPILLIQTTLTGQLSLLALIEMLESEGIPVISANTDGIVIKCPRDKLMLHELIVWEWGHLTGFETEVTEYKAVYSRDVNNYIAIKNDGKYKVKGAYAPPEPIGSSWPNPGNQICKDAVVKFLISGTDISETIRSCRDATKFVTVRTVKGGAVDQQGNYLGKAVRWYYANGVEEPLRYKINGYKVPRTEGGRPLMDLPESVPKDINYEWYINESYSILKDIGFAQ